MIYHFSLLIRHLPLFISFFSIKSITFFSLSLCSSLLLCVVVPLLFSRRILPGEIPRCSYCSSSCWSIWSCLSFNFTPRSLGTIASFQFRNEGESGDPRRRFSREMNSWIEVTRHAWFRSMTLTCENDRASSIFCCCSRRRVMIKRCSVGIVELI